MPADSGPQDPTDASHPPNRPDPVDLVSPELSLAPLLSLASLPSLTLPQVAKTLDASDRAYRAAWQSWLRLHDQLPDSWSRFRVAITGVLRHIERARVMQQMGNAAALTVTPPEVLGTAELFALLRETNRQYWAAVDALLENSAVMGQLLPPADRAELVHDWIVRLECRVTTLRDVRNDALGDAFTQGASTATLAGRLKVSRAAVAKILRKPGTPVSRG